MLLIVTNGERSKNMTKTISVRVTDKLLSLMKQATEKKKDGTTKNYDRNKLMVDAIETYCKGVVGES